MLKLCITCALRYFKLLSKQLRYLSKTFIYALGPLNVVFNG